LSVRLNKLLAERGLGARRKCDALIQSGAVSVNGSVVTELGTQVEPERDRVMVRGRPLPPRAPLRYFALNKPVGVITTLEDPEGRRTIRDLLPPGPRLFPIGRLDADTSGLLVLTNDGELAHRLMHPRYGVEKVYRVRVDRVPDPGALARLRGGVEFEPGVWSSPARVRLLESARGGGIIEIAIHEGRYRQVRKMCEAVGLGVRALHRSAYGSLRLGHLERGMWRELSDQEVARLRAASARPRERGGPPRRYVGGREQRERLGRETAVSRGVAPRPGTGTRPPRSGSGEGARRAREERPGFARPSRSGARDRPRLGARDESGPPRARRPERAPFDRSSRERARPGHGETGRARVDRSGRERARPRDETGRAPFAGASRERRRPRSESSVFMPFDRSSRDRTRPRDEIGRAPVERPSRERGKSRPGAGAFARYDRSSRERARPRTEAGRAPFERSTRDRGASRPERGFGPRPRPFRGEERGPDARGKRGTSGRPRDARVGQNPRRPAPPRSSRRPERAPNPGRGRSRP
jgi:23S rRNA pseudouridine2605 synthase